MTPLAAIAPRTADLPPAADGKPRGVRFYDVAEEGYSVPFVAVVTHGGKATGYGVEEVPSVGHLTFRVRKAGHGGAYTVTCGPAGSYCDCPAGDIGRVDTCRHRLLVAAALNNGWM
jgi:hypothetical protein